MNLLSSLILLLSLQTISADDQSINGLTCKSTSRFKFDPLTKPTNTVLTYCHQYSQSTCCQASHTQLILDDVTGFYTGDGDYLINDRCRSMTSGMLCSDCDAEMGVGLVDGVCEHMCNDWYDACKTHFFQSINRIQPCNHDSLICTKLDHFIHSGKQFCERFGLKVRSSSQSINEPITTIQSINQSISHTAESFLALASDHIESSKPCFSLTNAEIRNQSINQSFKRARSYQSTNQSIDSSIWSTFLSVLATPVSMQSFNLRSLLKSISQSIGQSVRSINRSVNQSIKNFRLTEQTVNYIFISIGLIGCLIVTIYLILPIIRFMRAYQIAAIERNARKAANEMRVKRLAKLDKR